MYRAGVDPTGFMVYALAFRVQRKGKEK